MPAEPDTGNPVLNVKSKTLLAIGAHYDDCPFGIPGILIQALRKHYRVVILNIIGDYSRWSPVKGREQELIETSIRLARERGFEMRFLGYASMQFDVSTETKRAVAEVVSELKPDLAFVLWNRDRHPDHEVAATISTMALRQPGTILGRDDIKGVGRIYAYDNGPGHTIGFEPNTYVDISQDWITAIEWLGQLMAFVRRKPFNPQALEGALSVKETLARYRGLACGAKYAEAVWAAGNYPREIF